MVGKSGITNDAEPLAATIRELERRLGRDINYTVLGAHELQDKLARHDPFINDVWHGKKVKLHG